jgi:predicted nucleic acid-binding protein
MSDIVVDRSVVAKWILPEAASAQALQILRETVAQGGKLIDLDLVFPEVTNAIWKRSRQGLITPSEGLDSLKSLMRLPVLIEPAFPVLEAAFDIARKFDRAIYAALFVALSAEMRLPGVTADERLFNGI